MRDPLSTIFYPLAPMRQTRSLVIGSGLEIALIKSSLRLLAPATVLKKFLGLRLALCQGQRCRFARPYFQGLAAELIAGRSNTIGTRTEDVLHLCNIFCSLVIGAVKSLNNNLQSKTNKFKNLINN